MRVSNEEKVYLQRTLAKLCVWRIQGELSEDQIADRLGFEAELTNTPAQSMYTRLKNVGLPDWLVYPGVSPQADEQRHAAGGEGTGRAAEESRRKARATGEAIQLPAAEGAANLLLRQLRPKLLPGEFPGWPESLEEDIDELHRLKEWLRGERFVSILYDEHQQEIYHKEELPDEAWRLLCEVEGQDPETSEAVLGPTNPFPLGASPIPWPGWIPLIALYALRNPSVEPLIQALHPDPASVDVEDLYKARNEEGARSDGIVTELRIAAGKLAIVVRGGRLRRGAPAPGISSFDLWVKWRFIDPLRRKGLAAEEIFAELKARGRPTKHVPTAEGTAFTVEEIRRLASLNLSAPEEAQD